MRLSCTVLEILSLIFQKLKCHDSDHAPFSDSLSSVAGTCYDQHAHQIWSLQLKPFQRYLRGTKNFNGSRNMTHVTWPRLFQERFVICRLLHAMFNPHTKYEVYMITCNKGMKGNAKCKNSRFEPPFEGLRGNAQWMLDGKRIVNLRLVVIELFCYLSRLRHY